MNDLVIDFEQSFLTKHKLNYSEMTTNKLHKRHYLLYKKRDST
ncbi:hypothetical protein HDC92_003782 [Pedobacter sp. AK017]|nr:hypothetical protein [Pedobacter sp. AK017]